MLRCTLNVFPTTNVLNGSTLSIYSTRKATKCRGKKSTFGIKNPSVKGLHFAFSPSR